RKLGEARVNARRPLRAYTLRRSWAKSPVDFHLSVLIADRPCESKDRLAPHRSRPSVRSRRMRPTVDHRVRHLNSGRNAVKDQAPESPTSRSPNLSRHRTLPCLEWDLSQLGC